MCGKVYHKKKACFLLCLLGKIRLASVAIAYIVAISIIATDNGMCYTFVCICSDHCQHCHWY